MRELDWIDGMLRQDDRMEQDKQVGPNPIEIFVLLVKT